jgi:hypothetical protein
MSQYLNHIAALTLNQLESVQPRLTSRFEAVSDGDDVGSLGNTGENQDIKVGEGPATVRTADIVERQTPNDVLIKSVTPTYLQVKTQDDGGQKQAMRAEPAASINATIKPAPKVTDAPAELAWPPMDLAKTKPIKTQPKPIAPPVQAIKQPAQHLQPEHNLNTIERLQERSFQAMQREIVGNESAASDNLVEIKRWEDVPRPLPVKPARITVRSEQLAAAPASVQSAQTTSVRAESSESPESTIQVTIGRIEIRATQTPDKPAPKPRAASTTMSLDDYLKQRNGGRS